MSISTYVLALLLILTFISRNYLLQKEAIPVVHSAYLQYKKEARKRRNALEVETYTAYAKANKPKPKVQKIGRTKPTETPHTPRTDKETKGYEKERTERRTSKRSALNLAPFPTSNTLRIVAIRLLLSLYEGTVLFHTDAAYLNKLAPLIIDHLQKQEGDSVTKRIKEARRAHPILYKMLKGTSTYNLKAKIGYPPLTDFLTINLKDPKAIHFHFASAPLLDVLFSERIRCIFYALELKKWKAFSHYPYVNKRELFAIIVKEKKSREFEEIESYLNFETSAE